MKKNVVCPDGFVEVPGCSGMYHASPNGDIENIPYALKTGKARNSFKWEYKL